MLKRYVDDLNLNENNGNIARIIGGGVGILGAAASIASVPLTGGLSLLGIALGIGGTATGIVTEIAVRLSEKQLMCQANSALEDDNNYAECLQQTVNSIKSDLDGIAQRILSCCLTTGKSIVDVVKNMERFAPIMVRASRFACPTMVNAASVGRIVRAGIAINVLIVPVEMIGIAVTASALKKDCKKAKWVKQWIVDLEANITELTTMLSYLENNILELYENAFI